MDIEGVIYGQMEGDDGWVNRLMDRWMDRWMDEEGYVKGWRKRGRDRDI